MRPANTFDVAATPPMYAARDAPSPPSSPCARRKPSSSTGAPFAAWHTRAALVAINVWKLTSVSSAVSTSCACRIDPRMRTIGSCANTTEPSGTASTVHVKRSARNASR